MAKGVPFMSSTVLKLIDTSVFEGKLSAHAYEVSGGIQTYSVTTCRYTGLIIADIKFDDSLPMLCAASRSYA